MAVIGEINILKDGALEEVIHEKAKKDALGNVIDETYAKANEVLPLTGGTVAGNLTVTGDLTAGNTYTKDEVDTLSSQKVDKTTGLSVVDGILCQTYIA